MCLETGTKGKKKEKKKTYGLESRDNAQSPAGSLLAYAP